MTMNQSHVTEAQAATASYQSKTAKLQSEATALAAQEAATNLAASAVSMVPGVGNVAAAAAGAKTAAEQKAFNAHALAEMTPATQRLTSSTGAVVGDMAANLQSDPRKARLVSLAGQKNCH
jgi:hypothetical protein